MEHLDFTLFAEPVNAKFLQLVNDKSVVLAYTATDSDVLYDLYLSSYPQNLNTVFRTRRHYDGSYDRNYIKRLGSLVAVKADGSVDSIWNVKVPDYFQAVADAMHNAVTQSTPTTIFLTDSKVAGSKPSKDSALDITWSHFYSVIPDQYVTKGEIGALTGKFNEDVGVFTRGLNELSLNSLETVLELINANSLYRGTEHKPAVVNFIEHKKKFAKIPAEKQGAYIIHTAKTVGPAVRFKNTVIGTLVEDLSAGVELEKAVASFEKKVAPENYKRPTALVTPRMIEDAQAKIEELGLTSALSRRHAKVLDIPIEHVKFTNQVQIALNVFDDLKDDVKSLVKAQSLSKVEEISLDHFLEHILPTSKTVEVLFENKHSNNLMSLLTAVDTDAAQLFKWDNNFSWSYNGEVADSMKERVKAFGGKAEGELRFSIQWNEPNEPNSNDLDAHAYEPNGGHIYFANNRERSSGTLDVDIRDPNGKIAVENIIYTDRSKMPEGVYTLKVHNFSQRGTSKGFSAEVEFDGTIFSFYHGDKIPNSGYITVAEVEFSKQNGFKMLSSLTGNHQSKQVWGLDTNRWVTVNNILLSPNAWNQEQRTGNEHLFFIIDNCKNPDSARGIYNEFLRPEFEPNRKVFELLGDKTKAAPSSEQASGLGFSSTRRDKVTVRVTGKTQRTFVINL
jgi:hypothetical protein